MVQITINVPEDVISSHESSNFAQQVQLAAAIYWYAHGDMSMGKAAQLAGMNRSEFLTVLAEEKVDAFQVDFNDLEQELARE